MKINTINYYLKFVGEVKCLLYNENRNKIGFYSFF